MTELLGLYLLAGLFFAVLFGTIAADTATRPEDEPNIRGLALIVVAWPAVAVAMAITLNWRGFRRGKR